MVGLLADENFNGRILRGLQRQSPHLDVLRAQDTELYGADDPSLLRWAAAEGRVVLTHDIATLVGFAYELLAAGEAMAGIVAVRSDCPIGRAIEDLRLLLEAGQPGDVEGRILFIPL